MLARTSVASAIVTVTGYSFNVDNGTLQRSWVDGVGGCE